MPIKNIIVIILFCSIKVYSQPFPFENGDKWYYKFNSYTGKKGFVVREIIDTTTNGGRKVSVKSYYNDGSSNVNEVEYWYYQGGNFTINNSTYPIADPIFISSLKNDSSNGSGASWSLLQKNYFGETYSSQSYGFYYFHMGFGVKKTTIVAEGLGLTSLTYSSFSSTIGGSEPTDSISIIGAFINNKLYGDSTNPIKSDTSEWLHTNFPDNLTINCIIVNGTDILAGTNAGIYISTNNGIDWSPSNAGLTNSYTYALVLIGNNLFAATNDGMVWTAVYSGGVRALAVSGANIIAAPDNGIYISTNNGLSWTDLNFNIHDVNCLAISGNNIFVGHDFGILLSSDNGTSWNSAIGLPTFRLSGTQITALMVSGINILAGISGLGGETGIFLSTNNGSSWTAVNSGLQYTQLIQAFAVSNSNIFTLTGDGGVYYTKNNGINWLNINPDWTNFNHGSLVISDSFVFLGTSYNGIWRYPLSRINTNVLLPSRNVPSEFFVKQNYPNPFNPATHINYELPLASHVLVKVYDMVGREVATLVDENKPGGYYTAVFNGSKFSTGIYFARITISSSKNNLFTKTLKMALVK
jgi:uncharacterized protein YneR